MLCGRRHLIAALVGAALAVSPAAAQQGAPARGAPRLRLPGVPVQRPAERQAARPQPQRPAAPRPQLAAPRGFQLNPDDESVVDLVLKKWEENNAKIKTFSCEFTLTEYKNQLQLGGQGPATPPEHTGRLNYAAPDKGMYQVDPIKKQPNSDENDLGGEHWVCDGKSVFEVRDDKNEIIERTLPPELQGKAIADAPLPFVFGSSAEKMQRRFWMRVSTPQRNFTQIVLKQGQVLLEAMPKHQQDAANFQMVQIIFNEKDMTPYAINEFLPNHAPKNEQRLLYVFGTPTINSPFAAIKNFFVNPTKKLGYKLIVEKPPVAEPLPQRPLVPAANLKGRPAAGPPLR